MSLLGDHVIVARDQQFTLPQLRLRELGLNHVPAVPVDIAGMLDTLVKLGVRAKQCEQAYQGLSRTFTIAGTTAHAHAFLFGAEAADAKRAAARDSLQAFLSSNPLEISPGALAARLKEQDEELAQGATAAVAIGSAGSRSTTPRNGRCPGPRFPTSTGRACRI